MTENTYKKNESRVYQATKIVAKIGLVGGFATQVVGLITRNHNLMEIGAYIGFPSIGYHFGTEAAEGQFKRASDLEKKLG